MLGATAKRAGPATRAGEYVVTFPRAYHLGFSHGSFPADSFHLMNFCTFSISVIYMP